MRILLSITFLALLLSCQEDVPGKTHREVTVEAYSNVDYYVTYTNESGGISQSSQSAGKRFRKTQTFKIGDVYAFDASVSLELGNLTIKAWADGYPIGNAETNDGASVSISGTVK
jgi:hypothetical protein